MEALMSVLTNQQLRDYFREQMAAAGVPIERVLGSTASQLWRITAGPHAGKTLRLRTNRDYAVMSLAETPDPEATIPSLDDVDFSGIACVNRSAEIECYLVPAARVVADMKAGHRASTEGGASGSKVRILYFRDKADREWYGYARKYADFRLGRQSAPSRRGGDVVERARRMIAEAFGVPPEAVHISVDLVPNRLIAHLPEVELPM
jgi:hypothetical protein